MKVRYRLAACLLAALWTVSPALARDIPAMDLNVSGPATPELLADFRQALNREARRAQGQGADRTVEDGVPFAPVDLQQFWKVKANLPYTDSAEDGQRLDIVYPFEGQPPYPLIVNLHDGGWRSGSHNDASSAPAYWAIYQGYALANVGYRSSYDARWPAQLHDAKAAIRFLRANAKRFELDAERIVAWGMGAGGHLAQMLAATNDDPTAEAAWLGHSEASSSVQGVVSWYGMSDLTTLPPAGSALAEQLLGYPVRDNPQALVASPRHRVGPDFPPIMLVHGTDDRLTPFEQSAQMALRVNANTRRQKARLHLVVNAGHGDQAIRNPRVMADSLNFVDSILFPEKDNPNRSSFYPGIQILDLE